MIKTLALLAVLSVAGLIAPQNAHAWGSNGHRIVARIGENHLSAEAKKQVRELTGGKSLALLATWPDFIRSNPSWDCVKPWHFLTVEDGQELIEAMQRAPDTSKPCATAIAELELPTNVVKAIDFFTALLKGDQGKENAFLDLLEKNGVEPYDDSIRLTALILLIHFVGDVHQPLHVGRGGDRGGNSITTNWFDTQSKLHSVWDSGLIDSEGLSYTEFVAFLEQLYAGKAVPPGSDAASWALESIEHRGQVYEIWNKTSRTNSLPELSYVYASEQIGLVQDRLYYGGRRLATLLNSIFD